jgi:8-oxo-dGTP diphosphatase
VTDDVPRVTRVAAYALCVEDGRLLLCRLAPGYTSDYDGWWTLPGGGLDFGEDPEAAAIRELAEETGLDGRVESVAAVYSWSRHLSGVVDAALPEVDYHAIQIVYRTRVVGGGLRDETDGSTDRAAWFTAAEASRLPLVDLARSGLELAFAESSEPILGR